MHVIYTNTKLNKRTNMFILKTSVSKVYFERTEIVNNYQQNRNKSKDKQPIYPEAPIITAQLHHYKVGEFSLQILKMLMGMTALRFAIYNYGSTLKPSPVKVGCIL